jgi:hypothetical protein
MLSKVRDCHAPAPVFRQEDAGARNDTLFIRSFLILGQSQTTEEGLSDRPSIHL